MVSNNMPSVEQSPAFDDRHYRRDRVFGAIAAGSFSLALGVAFVAVPLLALEVGYSAAQIGLLVALSAVAQLTARSFMGVMLRRLPDKVFVVGAAALIALSCVLVAASTTIAAFALSLVLQGVARAFFWTGSQTHAVRVSHSAVSAMTTVHLAGGIGSLVGPILAGILSEQSAQLALVVGVAIGLLSVIPAVLLINLPPFETVARPEPGRIWRRPGVDAACWTGVTGGVWRGLLNSYVPVVLALAAQSATTIGILISIANATALLGSGLAIKVRHAGIRASLIIGVVATGLGTAALGPLASVPVAAAVALAVSGIGAGLLQTIGPAIATEVVHPEERGDVIASVGLFRAAALFVAPLGMAGMVLIVPVGVGFLFAGALSLLPMVVAMKPAPIR